MHINVATDCSGIETPLMALDKLGIKYRHLFSSDIDKHCRRFINMNFPPEVMYDNIIGRDNSPWIDKVDLYIAGFPCQAFSILGKREGFNVEKGQIFNYVFQFISECHPNVFILENVRGLKTHNKGETMRYIMDRLNSLEDYNVDWKLLNTTDFGIPQNRNRIYFIGIKKKFGKPTFPEPIPMRHIDEFLDDLPTEPLRDNLNTAVQRTLAKYNAKGNRYIIYIGNGSESWWKLGKENICPTLLTDAYRKFRIVWLDRCLSIRECMRLQGIDMDRYKWDGFSNTQLCRFVGNAMTIDVLCAIYTKHLDILALFRQRDTNDN